MSQLEITNVSKTYKKSKRRLFNKDLQPEENQDDNVWFSHKKRFPLQKLTKWTKALDNVSLFVEEGEIIGLLGPNGAGKTTLAKIVSTLVLPDSGSVKVNGFDVERETVKARFSIGLVTGGERSLYWKLTPNQNLRFFGSLYGMTPSETLNRASELIKIFGLEKKQDELVQDLSTGYKMKTAFARSLMHDPDILVLDEYNRGLDPNASRQLRDYIKDVLLGEQSKTILMMTHSMQVAEDLSNRVVLIDQGKIIANDNSQNLKATLGQTQIVDIELDQDPTAELVQDLSELGDLVENGDQTVKMKVKHTPEMTYQILDVLNSSSVNVLNFNITLPSLEDVFIHYTGRKIEGDDS